MFRVLFHCQISSVWFTTLLGKFISRFFHFMVSLIDLLPREDIQLFLPKMQELDMHDKWFQQGGAKCRKARVTMDSLGGKLGAYFISHTG